jgi:N utilization substance protein B
MAKRSRAREVALQLLFQRDHNPGVDRVAVERFVHDRLRDPELEPFCLGLYDGVLDRRDDIDARLAAAAENWRVPRMAAVDRNVLRLGAYELLFAGVAPANVALDEAIELARRYGSADSPGFVNGVLDQLRHASEGRNTPGEVTAAEHPERLNDRHASEGRETPGERDRVPVAVGQEEIRQASEGRETSGQVAGELGDAGRPMKRYFTHYWNREQYQESLAGDKAVKGTPLDHTAGTMFTLRGIKPGDIVYVVSVKEGRLYLIGKMEVGEILFSDEEARSRIGYEPWSAPEHLIARVCTPIQPDLLVPADMVERLRFISPLGKVRPKFDKPGVLNRQALRIIRELEPESAEELNSLLPAMAEWSLRTPSVWGRWPPKTGG